MLDLTHSGMVVLLLCVPTLSVLFCGPLFVLQLCLLDAFIVYESHFLLSFGLHITLPVFLGLFSTLMSGIPSSAGPSAGTTRNLNLSLFIFVS